MFYVFSAFHWVWGSPCSRPICTSGVHLFFSVLGICSIVTGTKGFDQFYLHDPFVLSSGVSLWDCDFLDLWWWCWVTLSWNIFAVQICHLSSLLCFVDLNCALWEMCHNSFYFIRTEYSSMASPMLWSSWKQTVVRLAATTETAFSQLPAYKPSSILTEKKGFWFVADSSMKMFSQY